MAERIYTRSGEGLEPLEEQPFKDENELQKLIADHPQLLDGEQMRPGDPRRWILIRREKGIPEGPSRPDRWTVDHLIIDQDAMPTLVEVKRSSNTEIRRTVVGQLLEYAAHASQTWSAEELRHTFEDSAKARDRDPDGDLAELLQADSEPDTEHFWKQVETNLAARRLRLLFVADEIPDPLEQVVKFLNEQMPEIEVLAVEIKQFRGKSGQVLVPRVIGRTSAVPNPSKRRKLTREVFLQELGSEVARSAAERIFDAAEDSGAVLAWGSRGLSIRTRCPAWSGLVSVAWLFPPKVSGWHGMTNLTFAAPLYNWSPEMEIRKLMERWLDEFSGDDFAREFSATGIDGWTIQYDDAKENIGRLVERLTNILASLQALESRPESP